MRLFLISLPIALLFLWPDLAEQLDFARPPRFLAIPANGLGYMCVFFHEIGHSISYWLYGYPSLPTFDFQDGGGMTYGGARIGPLLWAAWLGMAAAGVWLWRHWHYGAFAVLGLFALAHAATALTEGHHNVIGYMGHGGEILIGGFCLVRAGLGAHDTKYGELERWLNAVFGLYTFGRNLIMSFGLAFSDLSRAAYAQQKKNGHIQSDFTRLAEDLHVKMQSVAWFSISFTLAVFILAVVLIYIGRRQEEEEPEVMRPRLRPSSSGGTPPVSSEPTQD